MIAGGIVALGLFLALHLVRVVVGIVADGSAYRTIRVGLAAVEVLAFGAVAFTMVAFVVSRLN